jgi:predicted nucleic acid-binding protein
MPCARSLRGRGAASSEPVRDADRKVVLKPQATGPVAIWDGGQSVRPWNTIAFTTSPDAARGGGFCRQRGVDRALALSRDPLHAQVREQWNLLHGAGAKLHTSIPVVIETFTFLDRNANRGVALTWRESIYKPGTVKILPCELRDLQQSSEYFRHADLYKLSAVDATSFAIMKRARIRRAYTFDHHFAAVGFRFVGIVKDWPALWAQRHMPAKNTLTAADPKYSRNGFRRSSPPSAIARTMTDPLRDLYSVGQQANV